MRVLRRDDTHWALELAMRHYWRQALGGREGPFQRISGQGVKPDFPQAATEREGLWHRMFHLPGRQAPGPDWAPLSIKVLDAASGGVRPSWSRGLVSDHRLSHQTSVL
jgi:hypothetical protein